MSRTTYPLEVHVCATVTYLNKWHTGPHANLIEITVPTKLANDRAWTRLPLAMRWASVENWSASHLSVGTLRYPAPRSTSKPRCFLYPIGNKPLLWRLIWRPDLKQSLSILIPINRHARTPLFGKKRSSRYGRTLIPYLLRNITFSLITLEKTQGDVECPNGRHVYP